MMVRQLTQVIRVHIRSILTDRPSAHQCIFDARMLTLRKE